MDETCSKTHLPGLHRNVTNNIISGNIFFFREAHKIPFCAPVYLVLVSFLFLEASPVAETFCS